MRLFIIASILLFATIANGKSHPKLSYPKFLAGKTHVYDVGINITAKIPGLRPQVSKRVLVAQLKVYAKTEHDLLISIQNVLGSGSLAYVGSDTDEVPLKPNQVLENYLKVPIKCFYKDGKVKSYTLHSKESLESKKIKRTILRNLEVYIDQKVLDSEVEDLPLTYNETKSSPAGSYSAHYVVVSSPYNRVPGQPSVFNISRVDNYEVIPYPAYESHHNFMAQGCPKVCRRENIENPLDAGCPVGQESYQTLMKKAFVQNHNLKVVQKGIIVIDEVETRETHVADVYDQNMQITINSALRFKEVTTEQLSHPSGQKEFRTLNNFSIEINEKEINSLCGSMKPKETVEAANRLLEEISDVFIKTHDLHSANETLNIGAKLVLLKKSLNVLKEVDFRHMQEGLVDYEKLGNASEIDKVKRQIWLDMLPLIGTKESIIFITNVIQENMNALHKSISLWEASSILNALPSNILHADEQVIHQLSKLLDLITNRQQPGYSIFFSASHIAMARTVNKMCAQRRHSAKKMESQEDSESDLLDSLTERLNSSNAGNLSHMMCHSYEVHGFFDYIVKQLNSTEDKSKHVIYIDALSRTGLSEALTILKPYVYGNIQELTPKYVDFMRIEALKSLHALVVSYPREVQLIVKPIFLNQSEPFKVRIAAFAVLVRTNPSLGLLQQVVAETWREKSVEVGSYVVSALESFANATLPCSQLLAHRIKKVFPQAKRFDLGYQRSKSLLWSLFDDSRGFGLAKYLHYSANNESILPNNAYGALEYTVDSFKDYFVQYSTHMQGISADDLYDYILQYLGINVAKPIPKDTVKNIFKKVKFTNRDPELWRMALYYKLFYSVSFNYFEGEGANFEGALNIVSDHLLHYLKPDSEGNLEGRIVKLYMPSSYRTSAIGHAYPSRIQFEMENPLLISLKFHIKHTNDVKTKTKFTKFFIEPHIYSSTVYRNQILNLGDCKNIGVYHESKSIFTFSFEFKLRAEAAGKLNFSYRFPDIPQKIFRYHSEAGTFAGAAKISTLPPPIEKKVPIRTIPTYFKKKANFSVVGFPPLSATIFTEDLMEEKEKIPEALKEKLIYIIAKYRNSGWRSKFVEVQRISGAGWSQNTEVGLDISFNRTHKTPFTFQRTPVDQLIRVLDIDKISETDSVKSIQQEGLILYNHIDEDQPHTEDNWTFNISKSENGTNLSWANLKVLHKYTLGRMMHHIRGEFSTKLDKMEKPLEGSVDYMAIFVGPPGMFRYNDNTYDLQLGLMVLGINFGPGGPFEDIDWIAKACINYEPLNGTLNRELFNPVDFDNFLPETHTECLRDMENAKSVSVSCVKAFRERSIYNNLKWLKIISEKKKATQKHLLSYIGHIDFPLNNLYQNVVENFKDFIKENITATGAYIDKLTDHPVYDLVLNRGNKTIKYRFPSSFLIQPLSGFERRIDTYLAQVTNNSYPASCALADKHILTYDLESYHLPDMSKACTYLLSAHCVKHKKFAVLVSTNFKNGEPKAVHLYFGNKIIILSLDVDGSNFKLNYNGKLHGVGPLNPMVLLEEDVVAASLIDELDISVVEVNAYGAGFRLFFDGRSILLRVSSRFKGELCGLCGDFDGDDHKDYKGLDGKFYENSEKEFVETFSLGNCTEEKPPILKPRRKCGEDMSAVGQDMDLGMKVEDEDACAFESLNEPKRMIKRNLVLHRDGKFCFSLKPLPSCDGNVPPSETEEETVAFKCFPRNDPVTRNKVKEARIRILREMSEEEIDLIEIVPVARSC